MKCYETRIGISIWAKTLKVMVLISPSRPIVVHMYGTTYVID